MTDCHVAITVTEITAVGEARRQAVKIAEAAGLDEATCGKVAIVVMELATNLVRYGKQGEILLRRLPTVDGPGVEVIAQDRGPGIDNIGRAMTDGYSTGGTPGNGLGAVRRLSTEFDMFSSPAIANQAGGTVVFSQVRAAMRASKAKRFEWGMVSLPAPLEDVCGDTWRITERDQQLAIIVADGLGHGPLAATAADAASEPFEADAFTLPTELLTLADRKLRGLRGAAVAIAQIDLSTKRLIYAGVGNIAGHLRSRRESTGKGLVSHNGTVGAEMRKLQQFDYAYPDEALLIMHSDGLQNRWSLEKYPGLINRHPAVIAAVLARDFTRGRDDVTVCIVRTSLAGDSA